MEANATDEAAIREMAYFRWLNAGAPAGDGIDHWLDAENEYFHTLDDERPGSLRRTRSLRAAAPGPDGSAAGPLTRRADREELIGSRG